MRVAELPPQSPTAHARPHHWRAWEATRPDRRRQRERAGAWQPHQDCQAHVPAWRGFVCVLWASSRGLGAELMRPRRRPDAARANVFEDVVKTKW